MDINRKTAYLVLVDVESKKAYSNLALNHQMVINKPNAPGFVRELVYGVLENKLTLDYYIDLLVKDGVKSLKTPELIILRMGVYQIAHMGSVPEYAAVNESVVLAKRYCHSKASLVNGVLREYINKKIQLRLPARGEDEVRYLSIKYSYAPWIVEMWLDHYDIDFVEKLLAAGNETPPMTIRLNWLRVMKPDLIKNLQERGFTVEQGSLCQNALHVKGNNLLDSDMYKLGLFTPQDESSMLVAEKLNPKQGDLVLDVCAAPGGKTTAIAERMNNTGRIIASDVYKRKLELIAPCHFGLEAVLNQILGCYESRFIPAAEGRSRSCRCTVLRSGCGAQKTGDQVQGIFDGNGTSAEETAGDPLGIVFLCKTRRHAALQHLHDKSGGKRRSRRSLPAQKSFV